MIRFETAPKFSSRGIVVGFLVLLLSALSSCDSNRFFEDNQSIAGDKWDYNDVKKFTVNVDDTTAHFNLCINVRHSFHYEWRNMYVMVTTEFPDGRKVDSRVNLSLSEPDGHWYARCIGDNCYISIPIKENTMFPQKGKYIFSIRQDMRQNPLPLVKYIGFRVEKVLQ